MNNDIRYKVYNITDSIVADYIFDCYIKNKTIGNIVDIYKTKPILCDGAIYGSPWILEYYNKTLDKDQDAYYLNISKWAMENNLLKYSLYLEIDMINQHDCVISDKECFNFSNIEDPVSDLFARECELLTTLIRDGKELGISIADRECILANISDIPLYDELYNLHKELYACLEREKICCAFSFNQSEDKIKKRRV